jgi:hypothetical protein
MSAKSSQSVHESEGLSGFTDHSERERMQDSYRAVSKTAVTALVLALLGETGWWVPSMLMVAAAAVIFGVISLAKLRRFPDELGGLGIATCALVLATTTAVGGTGLHIYEYMTEVPDGFERIGFHQLQPDSDRSASPVPPFAMLQNGKQVFIKGYVHPGVSTFGEVKSFVLVPDMKTCCFGGQPEITDMIEVTLAEPLRIEYSMRKRKLWGEFTLSDMQHVAVGQLSSGKQLQGGYYKLHAVGLK